MVSRLELTQPDPAGFDLDAWPRSDMMTMRAEVVMVAIDEGKPRLLMMKRERPPFEHGLTLPGQYLGDDETLERLARRIPRMLGIKAGTPRLFGVYSQPGRDPRNRAIAAAYLCAADFVQMTSLTHQDPRFHMVTFDPGSPAAYGNLVFSGQDFFQIPFDHDSIIFHAFLTMQDTLDHSMIAFDFLGETFTLFELQRVHEALLRSPLDKILFRQRMLARRFVNGTRLVRCEELRATAGRPAATYRLVRQLGQASQAE